MSKMHDELMPFTPEQLGKYFQDSTSEDKDKYRNLQVQYFANSIRNYDSCDKNKDNPNYKTLRQAEKDERFFTTRAFVGMFESPNKQELVKQMLENAFGVKPPKGIGFKTWDDAIGTDIGLFLEYQVSSPKVYREYLAQNLKDRHLVEYVFDQAKKKDSDEYRGNLEGSTHVDAYIFNPKTKFRVFIEAKYLSDISYDVSYDIARNQIARNIDCMLDDPEYKSLFMLVTPQFFIDNPRTRLYGYKMSEYRADGELLQLDLPHRALDKETKLNLPKQLAWVSWEELGEIIR